MAVGRHDERGQWDAAAHGWRKWCDHIEASASNVSVRMVELARIGAGSVVLDVACGYGEPSLTAARAAGPDGKIVATDISAQMLAHGRQRAAAAGITTVEFVEKAAGDLNFPPGAFDAVLSRWGVVFDSDAESVLARIRGFARPGARVVVSSWAQQRRQSLQAVSMQAARTALHLPPADEPKQRSRPVGDLLAAAGCTAVDVERMGVVLTFASAAVFAAYISDVSPPLRALIDRRAQARDEVLAAIADAVHTHADADGTIRPSNVALIASGTA